MTRTRHVFGRVHFEHEGRRYVVEMTTKGIWLRKKFARSKQHISFVELVSLSEGQRLLPLQSVIASTNALT